MNKEELVNKVVEDTGFDKAEVSKTVDKVFNTIVTALSEGTDVSIYGFGNYVVKTTNERNGRNPKTGESIVIPAGKKVAFKPAKRLKDLVG